LPLSIFFHRIRRYLRYWLFCVDEHSLQAPFLFDLYTTVLITLGKATPPRSIESWRQRWIASDQKIALATLGATATVPNPQRISQIAKSGISSIQTSQLLARLIRKFECKTILEIGTSLGVNAAYLANNPSVEILITIEANPQLCEFAQQTFDEYKNKIELICGQARSVLQNLRKKNIKIDFAFIDASHTYRATIEYFELLKSMAKDNSVFVFDDINWSFEMTRAWLDIKQDSEITLAIENDRLGIVFFNTNCTKKSYVLRF